MSESQLLVHVVRSRSLSNPLPHSPNCAEVIYGWPRRSEGDDYSTRAAAGRPYLMTHSEAFVETMVAHGVDTTFGIVGSAFMDALDLFPSAGIRFVSVQHEQVR